MDRGERADACPKITDIVGGTKLADFEPSALRSPAAELGFGSLFVA